MSLAKKAHKKKKKKKKIVPGGNREWWAAPPGVARTLDCNLGRLNGQCEQSLGSMATVQTFRLCACPLNPPYLHLGKHGTGNQLSTGSLRAADSLITNVHLLKMICIGFHFNSILYNCIHTHFRYMWCVITKAI